MILARSWVDEPRVSTHLKEARARVQRGREEKRAAGPAGFRESVIPPSLFLFPLHRISPRGRSEMRSRSSAWAGPWTLVLQDFASAKVSASRLGKIGWGRDTIPDRHGNWLLTDRALSPTVQRSTYLQYESCSSEQTSPIDGSITSLMIFDDLSVYGLS